MDNDALATLLVVGLLIYVAPLFAAVGEAERGVHAGVKAVVSFGFGHIPFGLQCQPLKRQCILAVFLCLFPWARPILEATVTVWSMSCLIRILLPNLLIG